ncbi:DUF3267 domain-containing protein [Ureibacillus sinduriensis]|uniref:Diaminopimelate epimerase n=1 Tax=Ureibacillus sinduriensis BLB-1 = JCM 15800 TaxID=1384057 RepID=A0A0A3HSN4_9BACL|nr:DUF3267 domain-containing protein [Ureibacillus sinduriensis]KGR75439.1 hypothetical protein CD33_12030 [Ureibacillus sinduriensis BLB-1 = JCM 15800]
MFANEVPTIIEIDMRRIAKINIWLTICLCLLFLILNGLIHQNFSGSMNIWDFFLFFVLYIVLIALHEIFHLIGFMLFGKVRFSQLDYGVNLKLGVAYATTTQPLTNKAMKRSLLLPFWTTGALPSLAGFMLNSNLLVIVGAFLIAGAAGDFYMYKELRRFPNGALIKDDPELPRLYVFQERI